MTDEIENKGAPDAAAITDKLGERIAKRLARAGVCSRRDAEKLIAEGRVSVNGSKLNTPALLVVPEDLIVVDGKPIAEPERTRVWRYNKPAGLMTTHKDPEGRATVFEKMPADMPRVISVGRLDYASEGLLLLTNDGELARKLELPANTWTRRYRVRVHGEVDPVKLLALEKGVTIDDVRYGEIKAVLERQKGSNAWVTVSIKEGKNREVRRVFEYLGWPVMRLIRVAYGPFQLGNLAEGEVEEVPGKVFKEQLGLEDSKWAKAEIDTSPVLPHKPGARKGGRTATSGGKDNPFRDHRIEGGRAEGPKKAVRPARKRDDDDDDDDFEIEVSQPRVSAQRPARADGDKRPARADGDKRPARAEGDKRPARTEGDKRPARAEGDKRPARAEGDKRPARAEGDKRPARAEGDKRPARAEGDKRPARAEGDKRSVRPEGDKATAKPKAKNVDRRRKR